MRTREKDLPLRLFGRIIRPDDLDFLQSLIAENPGFNPRQLAYEICRVWSWNKPNGTPMVTSARLLLLQLHDSGLLQVPLARCPFRPVVKRSNHPCAPKHSSELTPIVGLAERVRKPACIKEEDLPLRLIGRIITPGDLGFLRTLLADNPGANRAQLAREVCRIWSWNKPNGTLKVISAGQLLLKLQDSGLLELPPPRKSSPCHRKIPLRTPLGEPLPKMHIELSELLPLQLQRVASQADHDIWREMIDRYHYLGYSNGVGAQMRYLVHSPLGLVALFGFGASSWHVKDRDRWIGWNEEQRNHFRHLVVNNSRFLVLPWIKCSNLASKLLSLVIHTLPGDWQTAYNYAPVLLETYVDQGRFWGTSYKAANWRLVGLTQGRGKKGPSKAVLPLKSVYLYPLTKDFRLILTGRKKPNHATPPRTRGDDLAE